MLQNATSKLGRGGRRKQPFAYTEYGAIQAANVLRSQRAIEMGILVVRAFVQMRVILSANKELAQRLDEPESRLERKLTTHDQTIAAILKAIRELMNPPIAKIKTDRIYGQSWRYNLEAPGATESMQRFTRCRAH